MTFRNETGLSVTFSKDVEVSVEEIISGGDSSCPIWEEYIGDFKDELRPHFELLMKAITEAGWVGEKASEVCNGYNFIFSDGVKMGFTWRAWGDLMQAIVGKREGYMAYYC